jgi:hypothetical protein
MTKKGEKPREFERFEELTKRLLRVPKKEVDQKEKERSKRQRRPKEPNSQ